MKSYADYTSRSNARKVVSWALVLTLLLTMFNVGAIAQVVLNLGYGTPSAGSSLKITWNQMDDADHYEYSVRNTTTDELIYDHKSTTSRSFTISGKYLIANNSYRVWVGAYRPEDVDGWPPSSHTAEWEFTVPDDTCYHDGETYQDIIKKVYKSISDTQHRATTTYDLCCYDCDEVLKENQVLEEIDDHFFDENGDCKLCDYTYSCPHTKSEVDVENSGYLPADEDVHIYFETGHYVCANANCGKEIEPYYYEEEEEHTFSNNTCRYCGYTKAEPLSVTVARGQQTAVAGESISATVTTKGGSGSFDYSWEVICDDTVVDRTDYSMSTDYSYVTTKSGNWQFKVYVKDTVSKEEVTATTSTITVSEATCNHTNKKNETIDTDYIKTSDTKHEIRTYYNVVCNDCGDVLSEGNYSSEIVDHVVGDSGQCVCGYTAPTETCEHTTSKPVQIDQRTEQYDEKWHKVITTYQDICANNDCGIILVASREETEMVAHTYDSNGQCTCGYVQPTDKCDHAPIETLVDTDYVEIDDTDHEIIRKYHYECECGQVNYDDTRTVTEPHVFENGTCVCGRTQPVAITYGGSFSQDSYTMTVGEKLNVDVTASTTNANLSRVTINVDSTGNDRLAYTDINGGTNWNGTLTLDGANAPLNVPGTYTIKLFVKVNNDDNAWAEVDRATLTVTEAAGCPHTSVEEYWEMTEGYSVTYKSISDTHHTASGHMYKFCTLCLSRVGDNYPVAIDEAHSFDAAGDCILCDYRVSCQHKETKPKVETSGYTSKGEEGHLFFQYGNLVCANTNCGKEIEPYYAEEMQDHTFSDNTCSLCGYSKAEELSVVVARGQSSAETGDIISATATAKGGSGSYKYAWEVICEGVVVNSTDYSMPSSYSYVANDMGSWTFKVYVKDASTGDVVTATTSVITVEMAACPHDLINTIQQGEPQYIKLSDTIHEIRTYYNDVCDVCGDVTNAGYYKSETATHTIDANGKCVCGYTAPTPTCDHVNSIPQQIGQPTVEKYDEQWHEVIYIYKDVCANETCQAVLNEHREVREMVVHAFDANGKCACGYVLPTVDCDHVAAKTELNPKYIAVDASCHHFTVTYHYECECGQVNYDEDAQSFDPHVYEGRICKLCSFENPCDHADFQKVISSVVEDDKNSNSTHFVVTTYTKICECGAVNPTPIVRTTVPCSFTKSADVQAKHEPQGHQYFDRCACGNATVNGKFKNYLSSCATCQQQYGDDALAKGTYNSSKVEELQQMLGFTGNAVDGDFGGNTENAVIEFQKKHGLPATGIVDDATWAKLVEEADSKHAEVLPGDITDETASDETGEEKGFSVSLANQTADAAFAVDDDVEEKISNLLDRQGASLSVGTIDDVVDQGAEGFNLGKAISQAFSDTTDAVFNDKTLQEAGNEYLKEMIKESLTHQGESLSVSEGRFGIKIPVDDIEDLNNFISATKDKFDWNSRHMGVIDTDDLLLEMKFWRNSKDIAEAVGNRIGDGLFILEAIDVANATLDDKKQLIEIINSYTANVEILNSMYESTQNALVKQACQELLSEIEEAKEGVFNEVRNRGAMSVAELAASRSFGLLMDAAPLISTITGAVNSVTRSENATYNIQDEMIVLSYVRSQVAADLKHSVVMDEIGTYSLFELYSVIEADAYETTLDFYENYANTVKGKIAGATGEYDHATVIQILNRDRSEFLIDCGEIRGMWINHYVDAIDD